MILWFNCIMERSLLVIQFFTVIVLPVRHATAHILGQCPFGVCYDFHCSVVDIDVAAFGTNAWVPPTERRACFRRPPSETTLGLSGLTSRFSARALGTVPAPAPIQPLICNCFRGRGVAGGVDQENPDRHQCLSSRSIERIRAKSGIVSKNVSPPISQTLEESFVDSRHQSEHQFHTPEIDFVL